MPKKTKPMTVTVTMTENQMALIQNALEEHFRLRMGQSFISLVDDLAFQNVEPDNGNKFSDELFDNCICRRDAARQKLEELFNICFDHDIKRMQKTEEVNNEIDMYQEIRHFRWLQRDPADRGNGTDSYEPLYWGTEPRMTIKRED